jgi:hypothetical protein
VPAGSVDAVPSIDDSAEDRVPTIDAGDAQSVEIAAPQSALATLATPFLPALAGMFGLGSAGLFATAGALKVRHRATGVGTQKKLPRHLEY